MDNEVWIPEVVAPHLEDDQVAVFLEITAMKLRNIGGQAWAVNSKGETREIALNQIYELAQELGTAVTQAKS